MQQDEEFEVVVVGAGFAGLAAAQVLGRAQRRVLLIGSGPTRNAEAAHAHNVLTRDGTPPAELLALGRAEVESLPRVATADLHVDAVARGHDGRWVVRAGDRVVHAEVVVIATGARDTLPEVEGLSAIWGRRAHTCPFCDGADYAGRRLLVIAEGEGAVHKRAMLSGWTEDLVIAAPGDVRSLMERGGDVVARLADGTEVAVDGVVGGAVPVPRLAAVPGRGRAHRGPCRAVDGAGRTSEPDLWAVGDCAWRDGAAGPGGQVVVAMAAGVRAAAAITLERLGVDVPPPPAVTRPESTPADDLRDFWERRYCERERIWSAKPNQRLVDEVADLTPGTALELGCGEGADAIWLAERGWQVTAVDVSATALARAEAAASERGVADRIDVIRADLGTGLPEGAYDLVTASYLLSPVTIPRREIMRAAARAVRPGGSLVVLSHLGFPPGHTPPAAHEPGHDVVFLTAEEELAELDLDPEGWDVVVAEPFDRPFSWPDGTSGMRTDTVVHVRRRR